MRRWDEAGSGTAAGDPVRAARRRVERAHAAVVAERAGGAVTRPGAIADAAADVLTAMRGWADELDAAAETYDRAARLPRGEPSEAVPAAMGCDGWRGS